MAEWLVGRMWAVQNGCSGRRRTDEGRTAGEPAAEAGQLVIEFAQDALKVAGFPQGKDILLLDTLLTESVISTQVVTSSYVRGS